MAGNIQNVDMGQLNLILNEYINNCQRLNVQTGMVEETLKSMRQYWTGKRMNAILNVWNSMNVTIYESVKFFIEDVNQVLSEIALQYKNMEAGKAINLSAQTLTALKSLQNPIPLTSETQIKFLQANVLKCQSSLNEYLTGSITAAKELVTRLDKLQQYSDSLGNLVTKYKAKSTSLQRTFVKLNTTLTNIVNDAIKVVQTTESYNEDDVKRI